MKKLIISNEELAIGRKDRQHCSEESKRAGKPRCQRGFIRDPEVFLIGFEPEFKQRSLPINLHSCH